MYKILIAATILATFSGCSERKYTTEFRNNLVEAEKFQDVESLPLLEPIIEPEPRKFCYGASLNAKDVSLVTLGSLLSKGYNENINVVPDDTLRISINLKDTCLEDVLSTLTNTYNIGYQSNDHGYTLYAPAVRTKIFALNYHNFQRVGSSYVSVTNSSFKGNQGNAQKNYSVIETKLEDKFWDNIGKTLNTIIQNDKIPTSKQQSKDQERPAVAIDRENGSVIVKAYPLALKNVEKFIKKVNASCLRQIVIEAKILEIELEEHLSAGIDWSLLHNHLKVASQNDLSSEGSLVAAVIRADLSTTKFRDYFSGIMSWLSTQGKLSVLSSPKISVLNNQRALIKFGEDSYFVTNVSNINFAAGNASSSSTQASNTTATTQASSGISLDPFFSGIALDATPTIINNREVILHLHPMVTRVSEENKVIQVNDRKSTLPLAKIQTRETDTIVRSYSGDIVIIGGLVQNYVKMEQSGLPLRGKLNRLFGAVSPRSKDRVRSELVILLRPLIVDAPLSYQNSYDHFLED